MRPFHYSLLCLGTQLRLGSAFSNTSSSALVNLQVEAIKVCDWELEISVQISALPLAGFITKGKVLGGMG